MHKVIYTKSLDNADDIIAESWEYVDKDDAVQLFNEQFTKIINEILDNELLNAKVSIHRHLALIVVENVHHCLSVVDDLNKKE